MSLSRHKVMRSARRVWRRMFTPLREGLRPPDYRDVRKRLARAERNLQRLFEWHYEALSREEDDLRDRLRRHEFGVYSQDGEDGILLYVFSRVGTTDRRFIEFGVGNPHKCNSANLVKNFGWTGLLIDCEPEYVQGAREFHASEDPDTPSPVTVLESMITAENVNDLFRSAGFDGEIDLLSIDIDGNDYWVWKAVDVVTPRVVVVEYNASLDPEQQLITKYDPAFRRFEKHPSGFYHSASLGALAALGRAKGYRLIGCDSRGLNAFFVRDDVAEGVFDEVSPRQAYYPEAARTRKATPQEQFEAIRHLEFESDDGR